ncbi:hypothetical protein [Streptomyces sp. NPDC094032]|uniref:hypothetical protein n=1 Tax=Streptomyces sp. NPDC094032 TaxID=3155308 RepID=UPI0033182B4A
MKTAGAARHRFPLSFREVEELLLARGIIVSHETVRVWCDRFGSECLPAPFTDLTLAAQQPVHRRLRASSGAGRTVSPVTGIDGVVSAARPRASRSRATSAADFPVRPGQFNFSDSRRIQKRFGFLGLIDFDEQCYADQVTAERTNLKPCQPSLAS